MNGRRHRWAWIVVLIQLVSIVIIGNRFSGSDPIVVVLLLIGALLTIEGIARLEGWGWRD